MEVFLILKSISHKSVLSVALRKVPACLAKYSLPNLTVLNQLKFIILWALEALLLTRYHTVREYFMVGLLVHVLLADRFAVLALSHS